MSPPAKPQTQRAGRRRPPADAAAGAPDVDGQALLVAAVEAAAGRTEQQLAQLTAAVERLLAQVADGRDSNAQASVALASLTQQVTNLEQARAADANELNRTKKKYARLKVEVETLRAERAALDRRKLASTTAAAGKLQSLPRQLLVMAQKLPVIRSFRRRAGLQRQLQIMAQSGLFDAQWYLAAYPDVAAAGLDPALHYLQKGWLETRDPGPDFNTSGYLKANPDVARSGLNPLLHYVEHGREEGRAIGVSASPKIRRSAEVFAPAAPCVQFPLAEPEPLRWRRSAVLERTRDEKISLGGRAVGSMISAELAPVLTRFAELTGMDIPVLPFTQGDTPVAPAPTLRDAWFVREDLLRLHWQAPPDTAWVVRCLQWQSGQQLALAGEGLVHGSPAMIDIELASPLKPLLILFATPDGRLVGGEVLAFPSLARGGLHHGELACIASDETQSKDCDLLARSRELESRLLALLDGHTRPLLRAIRVRLDGADGTGPLFQPALQDWLAQIMHIALIDPVPPAEREPAVARFLVDRSAALQPPRQLALRQAATATLDVAHDCCPSLEILLAAAAAPGDVASGGSIPLSLLSTTSDPNQAFVVAGLPQGSAAALVGAAAQAESGWPRLDGGEDGHQALLGAIRSRRVRPIAEPELLEPTPQNIPIGNEPVHQDAVAVVLEPANWQPDALTAALAALAAQTCADQLDLCLIGPRSPSGEAAIMRQFGRPAVLASSWADAAEGLAPGLVLHLGVGIILHDRRTIAHLAALASRDTVAGASCAILAPSRRGREWVHAIDDAGMGVGDAGLAALAPIVTNFWNMVMPVAQLPAALWLARTDLLAGHRHQPETILLLSTHVTASLFSDGPAPHAAASPPAANAERALRMTRCVA